MAELIPKLKSYSEAVIHKKDHDMSQMIEKETET